jgi:hypothetical protein
MLKWWKMSRFSLALSAVLDWGKRISGRCRRFAGLGHLHMVGRENGLAIDRFMADSNSIYVDVDGGLVEFKKISELLRIGDRLRVFCDDGVIEAEKISAKQFKLIYAVETNGSIQ